MTCCSHKRFSIWERATEIRITWRDALRITVSEMQLGCCMDGERTALLHRCDCAAMRLYDDMRYTGTDTWQRASCLFLIASTYFLKLLIYVLKN